MTALPQDGAAARPRVRTPVAAVALAACVVALLAMLAGLLIQQSYRDALNRAEDGARTAANTVSAHIQWMTEAARQALRRVDDKLGPDPALRSQGERAGLDLAVEALPERVTLRVFDAAGEPLLSSGRPASSWPSQAGEPTFAALKGGAEWVVAPLFTDPASGEKVFAVGRSLRRDGRFAGAALVVVPAVVMADFWSSLSLGPGSTVSVLRDDGWLVARYPVPDATIDLSGYVLFTEHLKKSPAGAYPAVSPADGVHRLVGYRRVPGAPLVAVASIATDTALDGFWSQMRRGGLLLLPLLAGVVVLSVWVARLLRRDEARAGELAEAIERNQLLFREIHHRVKNNLQAVASMVQLQPISADAKADMRARINAMAAVHEHIYASDQFASVDAGDYIRKLADTLQAAQVRPVRIAVEADRLALPPDDAMSLGLIVNEAVSNALKHAFPDDRPGRIRVRLRADGDRALLLVQDDGVGFDAATPAKGMGMRLVRGLAERLGAEWRVRRENGTVFELSFALPPA